MQKNMESSIFRLLLIVSVVATIAAGISACSSDDDDSITPDITSIVEGFTSNVISGEGEDEVDVDLRRPLTSPTGQTLTVLEQITLPPSEIVASTRSDADGFYRFNDVPANESYFITYTKAGYIDEAYFEVTVEPEPLVVLEPVPLLETTFDTSAGIISGAITNAAEPVSPLGGVLVRARAGINNQSGTVLQEVETSDNGLYSLAPLDAGNYTLEASRSGYQTAHFDALVLDADGDPLTTNETVVGIVALVPEFLAGESFSFSGNVFAAFDLASTTGPFPLGGAAVWIREGLDTTVGTITTEGFTNIEGAYGFGSIPAGQYTLEGALSGFNTGYIDVSLATSLTNQNVTLMPVVPIDKAQQITVVLTWRTDIDLDGRLTEVAPEPVLVESLNDDRDGFGPETTLLEVVDPGVRYEYLVEDFADQLGLPLAASGAQVRVYRGNILRFSFDLPLNDPDASVAEDWHVFTIEDDRIIPVNDLTVGPIIRIADASTLEQDLVNQPLDFAVRLDSASSSDIILEMATLDGTATAGSDYQSSNFLYSTDGGDTWIDAAGLNGTIVTIPAGSQSILVRVFSIADNFTESDETFLLGVSRIIFGIVDDFADTGTGTIVNDDLIG